MSDTNWADKLAFYADQNVPVKVGFITAEEVDIKRRVEAF